jgi:hypothetical protein
MDLQLIKSNIVRNTLDSLAQTIHPRTAYVEGAVNTDDLMNVETGGLVRVTQPGMIQELGSTFVGQQAMPILAYIDDIKAARTGMSKASQGLDADVLQSTTKAAVTATMSAAQERLDMDVVVNVGLGTGSIEQKVQTLMAVLAQQKEILQTLGPNNPIVTIKQMRNTIAQILELQGVKDASRYFNEITPEIEQQMAQPPQPAPDPTQILAQVEAEKIKKDIEIADKKMAVEIATQKASDDRERDKIETDLWLKAYEMSLKYGVPVPVEQAFALIDRPRDLAPQPMGVQ